ncbi:hypothetical protein ABIF38_000381 [Bradyrhizobium japonicum]|nr:hypothetical protein [Bradyrhizobium elkanii]MCP1737554.1 hypothetical protein [Bradyrhizobium elkanii]MCS3576111.1 hypothetical protein [Bradyrhizobium elkanii]MCS3594554.1 hypothetical protein [Bradyrhizobium elkanii]MCS3626143.1 hypothetical protein [Bradyrhizobium elkanii]
MAKPKQSRRICQRSMDASELAPLVTSLWPIYGRRDIPA